MDGTILDVKESESDPLELEIDGVAVPVNATEIIIFKMYIDVPKTTVGA